NCDKYLLSNSLMKFENLTLNNNNSNLLPMDIGSEVSSDYQESSSSRGQKHASQQINTQESSNFVPLQYEHSFCENRYPILPSHFHLIKKITPLMLFYEFFTVDSLKQIVKSTNKYYAIQNSAGTERP
ncbi:5248_t:CDS:2, partial [Racocetra fulgida]